MIASIFGESIAASWVHDLLLINVFDVHALTRRSRIPKSPRRQWVKFCVGQPLGFLSSWPLFALTHHFMIWFCAEQVYPGVRFTRYAVLGDDVVIADTMVSQRYLLLMNDLDVRISVNNHPTRKGGIPKT
jgi:hypothetical protein